MLSQALKSRSTFGLLTVP
jgi:ATP synthase F1 complex assembly factor 1